MIKIYYTSWREPPPFPPLNGRFYCTSQDLGGALISWPLVYQFMGHLSTNLLSFLSVTNF